MSMDDKMKRMMVILRKENHREKRMRVLQDARRYVSGQIWLVLKPEDREMLRGSI